MLRYDQRKGEANPRGNDPRNIEELRLCIDTPADTGLLLVMLPRTEPYPAGWQQLPCIKEARVGKFSVRASPHRDEHTNTPMIRFNISQFG